MGARKRFRAAWSWHALRPFQFVFWVWYVTQSTVFRDVTLALASLRVVLIALAVVALDAWITRWPGVIVTPEGVLLRGMVRRRFALWADVSGFEIKLLAPGDPWLFLRLSSGRRMRMPTMTASTRFDVMGFEPFPPVVRDEAGVRSNMWTTFEGIAGEHGVAFDWGPETAPAAVSATAPGR